MWHDVCMFVAAVCTKDCNHLPAESAGNVLLCV